MKHPTSDITDQPRTQGVRACTSTPPSHIWYGVCIPLRWDQSLLAVQNIVRNSVLVNAAWSLGEKRFDQRTAEFATCKAPFTMPAKRPHGNLEERIGCTRAPFVLERHGCGTRRESWREGRAVKVSKVERIVASAGSWACRSLLRTISSISSTRPTAPPMLGSSLLWRCHRASNACSTAF